MKKAARILFAASSIALCAAVLAEDCNVKIVTDANPDYYDVPSLVRSVTSKWETPKDKCFAMFYWQHFARRQTTPMDMHGLELTDPIAQYNDYGYTMCSTISGINCGIWFNMGLKPRFHDVIAHTVADVEYDGKFHMYDNSLSAMYTLCDGKTLASVPDLKATAGCALSGGKQEPGHYVLYHCLCSTSPRGALIGSDTLRSLQDEVHVYSNDLYRDYYYNWDFGHRYILNLKDGETYTRYYSKLDDPSFEKNKKGGDPKFYVPNPGLGGADKDPEAPNRRYHQRGNGVWKFTPSLKAADYHNVIYSAANISAKDGFGLHPQKPGAPAEVTYLVQGANVVTSQSITGTILRKTDKDAAKISVSSDNGLHWKEVWKAEGSGELPVKLDLLGEVNGGYEILVKFELQAAASIEDVALKALEIETRTQINAKTNSRLSLGKNTVYVGLGEQTESYIFWPDLRGEAYKQHIVEEKNIVTDKDHSGWHGVLRPNKANEDGYLVYKLEAPNDITKFTYGGRFYPRVGHLDLLHSFDGGKTWTKSYTLKEAHPFDVIHYETIEAPKGTKSVLVKYLMNSFESGGQSFGIYGLRMEVNYVPNDTTFKPIEVTYTWDEVQKDYSRTEHSHTQLIEKVPFKYTINVGGYDIPVMKSLRTNLKGAAGELKYGYGDGKDPGGEKFVGQWMTLGTNLALNKPYTNSIPSEKAWGAGDPENKKLTDGVVGSTFAGGPAPGWGVLYKENSNPEITVDLGKVETCGVFRIHMTAGWPWWDAMKGEVKDEVEVLTSTDGKEFVSQGKYDFRLHYRDIPVNIMLPDDETATGWNFQLAPPKPVQAQYVKYKIAAKRMLVVTEVEIFDKITYEPFDLKIALPDEK